MPSQRTQMVDVAKQVILFLSTLLHKQVSFRLTTSAHQIRKGIFTYIWILLYMDYMYNYLDLSNHRSAFVYCIINKTLN